MKSLQTVCIVLVVSIFVISLVTDVEAKTSRRSSKHKSSNRGNRHRSSNHHSTSSSHHSSGSSHHSSSSSHHSSETGSSHHASSRPHESRHHDSGSSHHDSDSSHHPSTSGNSHHDSDSSHHTSTSGNSQHVSDSGNIHHNDANSESSSHSMTSKRPTVMEHTPTDRTHDQHTPTDYNHVQLTAQHHSPNQHSPTDHYPLKRNSTGLYSSHHPTQHYPATHDTTTHYNNNHYYSQPAHYQPTHVPLPPGGYHIPTGSTYPATVIYVQEQPYWDDSAYDSGRQIGRRIGEAIFRKKQNAPQQSPNNVGTTPNPSTVIVNNGPPTPNEAPNGVICMPVIIPQPDPQNPSKTIEVQQTACYPAPAPAVPQQPYMPEGTSVPLAPFNSPPQIGTEFAPNTPSAGIQNQVPNVNKNINGSGRWD